MYLDKFGSIYQCRKLFEPIMIGGMEVKNRLAMTGIHTHYGANNTVNQRVINFYSTRAKGGAGLIFTCICYPNSASEAETGSIGIYDDEFIPGLRELVNAVHAHDAKIAIQIGIRYQWKPEKNASAEYVGPSAVITNPSMGSPRELKCHEIHQIVHEHVEAARRAREAGFDAIDFVCAGGYLVDRFLSACTNKRTDEYGGSLENRGRLISDIIRLAKAKVGHDFPILCRLGLQDFMKGGITIEDSKIVATLLEKAGVNCLVSHVGWHEAPIPTIQASVPPGHFVHLAEQIKKMVNIPVMATIRINHPLLAEKYLAEGKADLIGMGRALIADPELPNKARDGRFDDIRPCIVCNRCIDLVFKEKALSCTVNAHVGKEGEYQIRTTSKSKKIFIAGGGPAGMETAALLAQRGHHVTLWEQADILGGNLIPAKIAPHKQEIGHFIDYLATQVRKQKVHIKLGEKLDLKYVEMHKPDVLIIATGANPIIPDIPGIAGNNVTIATKVLLNDARDTGTKILIIGGGLVGCETAEFLAEKNKEVTILEILDSIGIDIGPSMRWVMLQSLKRAGVAIETGVNIIKISTGGVEAMRAGKTVCFAADTIVLAAGLKPNTALIDGLIDKKIDYYTVGDCTKPARIAEAIEVANRIGTTL